MVDGVDWALAGVDVPFVVEVVDSAGDPEIAIAAIERLAADPSVIGILGPLGASVTERAAPVADELGVPLLTLSSIDGIEEVGRHVFRLRMSPEDQSRVMARLAVQHLESERAAVFYPDHAYGRGCARAFVDAYRAAGGRITALETFDPEETRIDEAAELLVGRRWRSVDLEDDGEIELERRNKTRRVHADFDVLFVPDAAPGVARGLAFLDLVGLSVDTVQLLGTSAWEGPELAGTEGRADGALVSRLFDPLVSLEVEARVDTFDALFGRKPTELEAQVHDGMRLVIAALARCPTLVTDDTGASHPGRACLEQGLRSVSGVDGVTGRVGLADDGGLRRAVHIFDVDHDGRLWPAY